MQSLAYGATNIRIYKIQDRDDNNGNYTNNFLDKVLKKLLFY